MTPREDLGGLDQRELLECVVLELRALRRLVGTVFIVGVVLVVALPVLAVVAG